MAKKKTTKKKSSKKKSTKKKSTKKKSSKKKSTKKSSKKKTSKSEEQKVEEEEVSIDPLDTLDYNVGDIPGVGSATRKKLVDAGYDTLQALAIIPPGVIMEDCGIGEKTSEKIVKAARDILNLDYKSAEDVWERRKNLARITSGCQQIDELLGGGFETGGITELFGEYRTGKTQICHQLCVNVQKPKSEGGIDGNALYIDTEGTFRPERLIQMAESHGMDPQNVLKRIFTARAYNSQHQIILIKDAHRQIAEHNINLVIVDSLISHFRSEYIGRGTLANRQQLLNQHIHDLQRLSDIYPNLAVIVTNQVQSKPDVFFGDPNRATGGHVLAHAATTRLYVRKGKGEQRVMKVKDSPNLPEGEAIFVISDGGIIDP
ncbi:MAG: DNA repair and recombination protein RadA [Candidatus Lokiarchaeota archaeon]|nr:DNA repair and recombination protein RadA [Candidatus Lokiarchaeota archaeon]